MKNIFEIVEKLNKKSDSAVKKMQPAPLSYGIFFTCASILLFYLSISSVESLSDFYKYMQGPIFLTAICFFAAGLYIILDRLNIVNYSKGFIGKFIGSVLYLTVFFSILAIVHIGAYNIILVDRGSAYKSFIFAIVLIFIDGWIILNAIAMFLKRKK
jgi:hypothetical protein